MENQTTNTDLSGFTEVKDPETILTDAKEKAILWENKYMYLAADFENYKKHTNKRLADIEKNKHKDLILKLLEVIDNCERSFVYDRKNQPIYDQLLSVLFNDGLEVMDVQVGDKFDEGIMNAVSVAPLTEDAIENTVAMRVRNGYKYKGEIIRFPDVIVYKS